MLAMIYIATFNRNIGYRYRFVRCARYTRCSDIILSVSFASPRGGWVYGFAHSRISRKDYCWQYARQTSYSGVDVFLAKYLLGD